MECFLVQNGSGASLNFTVKAFPSEVELNTATAVANTIGVVTTNPITGWYFASEQPENMAEGEVWFNTGTSSPVKFNALKQKSIMVYPLSAKQMVSGELKDVTAKSYQDGKWVGWIDYIYYKGETEYTFTSAAKKFNSSSSVNAYAPTITLHDDCVELSLTSNTGSSRGRTGLVYITEKTDLTDVKTLVFDGDFYQSFNKTYPKIRIFSNIGTYMDDNMVAEMTSIVDTVDAVFSKTVELDVSAVSGENYIGFCMLTDTDSTTVPETSYIKLRQIYKK